MNFDFNSIFNEIVAAIKKDPYESVSCKEVHEIWGQNLDKNDWLIAFKHFIENEPSLELKRGRFGGVKIVNQKKQIILNDQENNQEIFNDLNNNTTFDYQMGPNPTDIGRKWAGSTSEEIRKKLNAACAHQNIDESIFIINGKKYMLQWPNSKFIEFMNVFVELKSKNSEIQKIFFEDQCFEIDMKIMPIFNNLLTFYGKWEIWDKK